MDNMLNLFVIVLLSVTIILLLMLQRKVGGDSGNAVRDELRASRQEAAEDARRLREEVVASQKVANELLTTTIGNIGKHQQEGLEAVSKRVQALIESNEANLEKLRAAIESQMKAIQLENGTRIEKLQQGVEKVVTNMTASQKEASSAVEQQVKALISSNETNLEKMRTTIESQMKSIQSGNETRIEKMQAGIEKVIVDMTAQQKEGAAVGEQQIKALITSNETHLERLRKTFSEQMHSLQEGNEKKLEQMRQTVDEKLQNTLEKRLGESFKLVSERLEAVQRGLGDMQSLATGVGDLKRMLTNVKTRGTWGEFQLGDILQQILTAEQFAHNVQPRPDSNKTVEYAIRLPGQKNSSNIWLPIDSKFPQEDYQRLIDAAERADADGVEKSTAALVRAIQVSAKDIADKYIEPPYTTDFAIMFLPTEGLYSEVLRQPGMVERLQQDYRVVVAGPTTLSAILNSLRMGFRTLAIEQRSSEVWTILSAVKTEFGKFGGILDRVKKQLDTASNTINQTSVRTRAMERKLKDVEDLPIERSAKLLNIPPAMVETSDEEASL